MPGKCRAGCAIPNKLPRHRWSGEEMVGPSGPVPPLLPGITIREVMSGRTLSSVLPRERGDVLVGENTVLVGENTPVDS